MQGHICALGTAQHTATAGNMHEAAARSMWQHVVLRSRLYSRRYAPMIEFAQVIIIIIMGIEGM